MNFKGIVSILGKTITKNSTTILTGMGVAGLISTTVLAVKATPKAIKLIEEAEWELDEDEELTKMDVVKLTYKCYIPSAIMGATTIACIIGAHSINTRRNAALAGLYSLSEKTLKEYQSKVAETIGEDKEREIRREVKKDKVRNNPVSTSEVIMTGGGNCLCYDAQSGRYFYSDPETIRSVLNSLSRQLMSDMFIPLNDVYHDLGLSGTKLGDTVGWHVDNGLIEPDFGAQMADDGRPCLVLDFTIEPKYVDRGY